MTTLEDRARRYAMAAHVGQLRRYTGEPYINHPAEVTAIIRAARHTDAMIAAAWLHDTVEDTHVTHENIVREFGPEVAKLVWWLTDVFPGAAGNRAKRKALNLMHLTTGDWQAQTVKIADMISNTTTIALRDPGFAPMYLREKELLVEALDLAEPGLRAFAREQIAVARGMLGTESLPSGSESAMAREVALETREVP